MGEEENKKNRRSGERKGEARDGIPVAREREIEKEKD